MTICQVCWKSYSHTRFRSSSEGTSFVVQWLRLSTSIHFRGPRVGSSVGGTKITAWQGKKKKSSREKIGGIPNVIFPFLCFAFRWAIEDKFNGNSMLSSGYNAEIVERQ